MKRTKTKTVIFAIILIISLALISFYVYKKTHEIKPYSITYSVSNGLYNYDAEIRILEDGKYIYDLKSLMDGKPTKSTGQLTVKQVKELGELILEKQFFDLPEDLSNNDATDQDSEEIILLWDNKEYRSGGYNVQNSEFRKLVDKIWSVIQE